MLPPSFIKSLKQRGLATLESRVRFSCCLLQRWLTAFARGGILMTGGDQIPSEVHPPAPLFDHFYVSPPHIFSHTPLIWPPFLKYFNTLSLWWLWNALLLERRSKGEEAVGEKVKRFATQRRHHWGFKDASSSYWRVKQCKMYLSKSKEGFVQFRNVFGQWIFLFVGKSKRFATQRQHHQGFKDALPSLWLRSTGQISTVFATHPSILLSDLVSTMRWSGTWISLDETQPLLLPGEMNIFQIQCKIDFNTFLLRKTHRRCKKWLKTMLVVHVG